MTERKRYTPPVVVEAPTCNNLGFWLRHGRRMVRAREFEMARETGQRIETSPPAGVRAITREAVEAGESALAWTQRFR